LNAKVAKPGLVPLTWRAAGPAEQTRD